VTLILNSRLLSCANQTDEAPPSDFGDETALVGRHSMVYDFLSKLLRLFGRFAHVDGVERWMWVVFDGQLNRFGLPATNNFAC
jgi:hypothetical protein